MQRELWTFEPRRRELAEHLGPLLLKSACWAVAAIIAVPLFLPVLLPFLD